MKKQILAEMKPIFLQLSHDQRFSLAVCVIKRMLPAYKLFSEQYQFGNLAILENAIKNAQNNTLPKKIDVLLEKIEKNAPDMDDFSGILLATAALDAVGAVYELLLMCQDHEVEHLEIIFSLALNIPYMYLCSQNLAPYQDLRMQAEIELLKNLTQQIKENKTIQNIENQWVERIKMENF